MPGKPKNDGAILQVRVSPETHAGIAQAMARLAATGLRPGLLTKAYIVEEAVKTYLGILKEPPDA